MQQQIITVVGGTGFLGRYVIKRLAGAGYTVRVLSRYPESVKSIRPCGNVGQIVGDYADLTKPETLKGKLTKSQAVINLAGLLFENSRHSFARVHAQGAERLAQTAKDEGVPKFIHISALGVDQITNSKYARTKLAGENAVRAIYPCATIFRPSVLFGAEDNFFNQFARLSLFSPALPCIGGGKTKFQPVYVDDVAKAIMVALTTPECEGNTYELGGPKVYSFKELLRFLLQTTGRCRVLAPIPFPIASIVGSVTQIFPTPLLTADQVKLLKHDNVVSDDAKNFASLGITPTSLEAVVPAYLSYLSKHKPTRTDLAA